MSDRRTNFAIRTTEDTRDIILAATEALFRRGGEDAVTLSAVAREGNFARGVIYAHFSSRQELLAAVRPHGEPAPVCRPDGALDAALAENAPESPVESYDEIVRAQAEALQELSKQVIVTKPRQRDAAEQALTRFDARLSVTEKSLAALDRRVGERLKSLDVEVGAVAERLHGLRQRLDKFEEKQTAALAQLRLDVHNLGANQAHAAPAVCVPAVAPESGSPCEAPAAIAGTPDLAPEPDAPVAPARMADYLISARRAAIDAADKASATAVKRKPAWRRLLGKRRWAILAVAAVLVAWFDVYVFAHYQPALGAVETAAAAPIVPPPIATRPAWSPRAQLVRGLKYLNGTGVPVDVVKARLWIERAALRGLPVAQNLMGVFYQTGTAVDANMPAAIGWYEGAANAGNLKAMTNLGKIYAGGWPGGTDFVKAAEWFAKAAAYGEADAQFDLAVLYERGEGVPVSIVQAYKWYAIAGAHGDTHAANRATTLAPQLAWGEREAADAAVAAFRPAPVDQDANETPQVSG